MSVAKIADSDIMAHDRGHICNIYSCVSCVIFELFHGLTSADKIFFFNKLVVSDNKFESLFFFPARTLSCYNSL